MIFLYLTTPVGAVIGVETPEEALEILKLLGCENPTIAATDSSSYIRKLETAKTSDDTPAPVKPRPPAAPKPKAKSRGRKAANPNSHRSMIRSAFAADPRQSMPLLCEEIYGDSSGKNMARLRNSINSLCFEGHLKRLGAGTFEAVGELP